MSLASPGTSAHILFKISQAGFLCVAGTKGVHLHCLAYFSFYYHLFMMEMSVPLTWEQQDTGLLGMRAENRTQVLCECSKCSNR